MLQVPNHIGLFFLQPRWGVCQVRQSRRVLSCVRATDVLAILMRSLPRVDQVVTELVGRVRGGRALGWLLSHIVWSTVVHDRVSDKVRETCIELVYKAFRGAHEHQGGRLTSGLRFRIQRGCAGSDSGNEEFGGGVLGVHPVVCDQT